MDASAQDRLVSSQKQPLSDGVDPGCVLLNLDSLHESNWACGEMEQHDKELCYAGCYVLHQDFAFGRHNGFILKIKVKLLP